MDGPVAGHAGGVHALQGADDAVSLRLRQPEVEAHQRPAEAAAQEHLVLVTPLRGEGVTVDVGPPQPLQQPPRRVLSGVELVEFGGGGHGAFSPVEANRRRKLGRRSGMSV